VKPFFSLEHPIAMAHRGSMVLWPENTMIAFQGAVDLGFRYLEMDVHATSDDVLVCVHDDTLDRTTNADGSIGSRSFADLEAFDAAYQFNRSRGFPLRGRGISIPSLEEVVTTFPDIHLTLDLKQRHLEALLVDLIDRLNLWDRVIVGSFHDARIRRFRRLSRSRVATSSGPIETSRHLLAARRSKPSPIVADALQVPVEFGRVNVVDTRFVDSAHDAGKQVHVWTVNDPRDMRRLLEMGVDGIITDRPDLLKEVLER
jgi:glycerophosphoryl diester phosphodiesterase